MDGLIKNISFAQQTKHDAWDDLSQGVDTSQFKHMNLSTLIDLKRRIDSYLPAMALKDVNLEEELLTQFALVKDLQSITMSDMDIPANQKAQVAGQVAAVLKQLVEMQMSLSREEEFKKMEQALLEAVGLLSEDAKAKFFDEYELLARKSGVR